MTRREVLKRSAVVAGGLTPIAATVRQAEASQPRRAIRFGVIGLNHDHIYAQTETVRRGGGQLISAYAVEPELLEAFIKRFPEARLAKDPREILDDASLQLVVSASIPSDRAPLGIEVMRHGKDFMSDKPGATTLAQLTDVRRVQKETGRIYSIMFNERFENAATVEASALVRAGAIGTPIHTVGLGPHRLRLPTRPSWFFDPSKYGGILCDIASHQFDQFLHFTGSTSADIVAAQIGNLHYPQYAGLQDFGDVMVRGNRGSGYIRVDWFTPDGLPTWGDGRLTILGTEGYIEIRKTVDLDGRKGGNHLFLVNGKATRYVDCSAVDLPYGRALVADVLDRTETAMPQAHCFLATELALKAQQSAIRLDPR